MSLWNKLKKLVSDPPPAFAFEVSGEGITWARTEEPFQQMWAPFAPGTLEITPVSDNVKSPEAYTQVVSRLAPPAPGVKVRPAALILPDFCARIAVLDFDTFPSDPDEQVALVRFRAKRAVPFEIESAVISCHPQPRAGGKKVDVVVVVINDEVAAHYQAPFRAAGYQCGVMTISALSALALPAEPQPAHGEPALWAKMSGNSLCLAILESGALRLIRTIEIEERSTEVFLEVLAPTVAFAEDQLGARPRVLQLCGVPEPEAAARRRWEEELGLQVGFARSRFGAVKLENAGLLGYLETVEGD